MSQPSIILQTPSGAVVELRTHKIGPRYSAKISINNTTVAHTYSRTKPTPDDNRLVFDDLTLIRLLPESMQAAIQFLGGES